MCELLIQGYPNVKIAELFGVTESCIKGTLKRIYKKFRIDYEACLPHIRLAVMLTYDRYPQLVPRGANYIHDDPRPGVGTRRADPQTPYDPVGVSYTQPIYSPTGQNKPTSAPFDHDSASLGRISPAHSYIH